MKRFKGTTGNWNMIENGDSSEFYTTFDKEPHLIVKHNEKSVKETEANAKLIAASPELLQNCIWCVNNFKNVLPVATKEEAARIYASLIENLEDVINKATK